MQHSSRKSILDSDVVAAWQEQMAAAGKTPICCPKLRADVTSYSPALRRITPS